MKKYYLQIYHHTLCTGEEGEWVHPGELGIHPDIAYQLAELGVVEIHQGLIPACQAARLQKVLRLRGGMGVNLPGAAIILELLERIEALQDELDRLRRRMT